MTSFELVNSFGGAPKPSSPMKHVKVGAAFGNAKRPQPAKTEAVFLMGAERLSTLRVESKLPTKPQVISPPIGSKPSPRLAASVSPKLRSLGMMRDLPPCQSTRASSGRGKHHLLSAYMWPCRGDLPPRATDRMNEDAAHAHLSHLAEGDLLRPHPAIKAALATARNHIAYC